MSRDAWGDGVQLAVPRRLRETVFRALGAALLRSALAILLISILGILDPTEHRQLALIWGTIAGAYFLVDLLPGDSTAHRPAQRGRDRPRAPQVLTDAVVVPALVVLGFGIIGTMDLTRHGDVAAIWTGMAAAWFALFYFGPLIWARLMRHVRRRPRR